MNDHSKDSQTRYLKETAIALAREGFQTDRTHTDRLCILLDGSPLCEVTGSGGVAYRNEDIDEPERIAAKDKVYEIVRTTAEYMRQMEMAPFLKADSLEDGYKVLADFNGTVLAGVQSKHGVHFVTWDWAYEDAEYHNAVFVGTDTDGVPRHAHKRSANRYGKAFRLNVESSDPRYSFHHVGTDRSLYVFEAPIDMLSFITLYPENWQRHSYVACCGTSIQPVLQMLEQAPQLGTILLCLDNDEAGHQASRRMREQLDARYSVERLIPENKDWNDDLTLSGGNAQGFSMNEMR